MDRAVFAQPQELGLSSSGEDPGPNQRPEQSDDVPSESKESEDSKLKDGSLASVAAVSVGMSAAGRVAMGAHACLRPSAGYDALARERGPPVG
ncbi:hypothetical protein [Enhygromyxa salina]|nr:hypothetical protein [Enhygromyxa salina]